MFSNISNSIDKFGKFVFTNFFENCTVGKFVKSQLIICTICFHEFFWELFQVEN